jgi:hypothetical protein
MSMRVPQIATILLLCISCSSLADRKVTILSDQLDHSDDLVEGISYQSQGWFYSGEMCIAISQRSVWEPGNTATQLYEHITSSVKVTIDDQEIERIANQSRTIEISVIEDGQVVGSHGSTLDLCFSVAGLATGNHVGNMQIVSSSGRMFSYDWEFHIG